MMLKILTVLAVSVSAATAFLAHPCHGVLPRSAVTGSRIPGSVRPLSPLARRRAIQSENANPSPSTQLASASDDAADGEEWTKKRLHNTPLFRSGAILASLAAAGYLSGSPLAALPAKAGATIHLLAYGTYLGSVFYTTFIAGITMFKNLPRKVFGKLQSKLFPKYFNLGAICCLLQLITLKSLGASSVPVAKSTKALGVAFGMTLLNLFYLEPTSTQFMFDRYELEEKEGGKDSDEYKKLASRFGKFHGMSSLTNLIAFCGAVAHGFFLASALV